ncbi:MAG: hypothetical protein KC425_15935 [Anaerolineales bacterium]|nr:hypothetical protein [Anaerolineales bacterium]
MKALSIKQPWLYCITDLPQIGAKRVENRTWTPPSQLIGERIALHASKTWDTRAGVAAASRLAMTYLEELRPSIPTGAVVATAVLVGVVRTDGTFYSALDVQLGFYRYDRWFFGPYGWIFDFVQKLPQPLPVLGARELSNCQGYGVGGDA